jgi:hypothetical protein
MHSLWLGYDNLTIACADIVAVLVYHTALDRRIALSYGYVPRNVRAVVVTHDGGYWPSSWRYEQLRRRLTRWRLSVAG